MDLQRVVVLQVLQCRHVRNKNRPSTGRSYRYHCNSGIFRKKLEDIYKDMYTSLELSGLVVVLEVVDVKTAVSARSLVAVLYISGIYLHDPGVVNMED